VRGSASRQEVNHDGAVSRCLVSMADSFCCWRGGAGLGRPGYRQGTRPIPPPVTLVAVLPDAGWSAGRSDGRGGAGDAGSRSGRLRHRPRHRAAGRPLPASSSSLVVASRGEELGPDLQPAGAVSDDQGNAKFGPSRRGSCGHVYRYCPGCGAELSHAPARVNRAAGVARLMSQTPLEYIASLRAQGHRDADIARACGGRLDAGPGGGPAAPLASGPAASRLAPSGLASGGALAAAGRARAAEPAPVVDPGRRNAWLGGVRARALLRLMVLAFVTSTPILATWSGTHRRLLLRWPPGRLRRFMPPPGGHPGERQQLAAVLPRHRKIPAVQPEPVPASSSGRIRAFAHAEIPDEVWLDDRMTLSAHGAHYLDPELARLVHTGQATMKEETGGTWIRR